MYHHFAKYYDTIFPFNEKSIVPLETWIKKGKKAIDLGCATGHLVSFLHQKGMKVTGVDLDHTMIEIARLNYPSLEFISQDMIDYLKNQKEIHLITCIGNTLPHLNQDQLKLFLKYAFDALAKDGVMIIQMLNYDKILTELPNHLPDISRDNILFERIYNYHQDHIVFETKLKVKNHITTGSTSLYPYLREELTGMIENQGFQVMSYQNLHLEPWTPVSSHQTWLIRH